MTEADDPKQCLILLRKAVSIMLDECYHCVEQNTPLPHCALLRIARLSGISERLKSLGRQLQHMPDEESISTIRHEIELIQASIKCL